MRWSRLKTLIQDIWVNNLKLDIHCSSYRSSTGPIGRYWIKLNNVVIWSVPENIDDSVAQGLNDGAASEITSLIRAYLDTAREELLRHEFNDDNWGIIDIMRAADRRIGKNRLVELSKKGVSAAAMLIIEARLKS